MKTQLEKLLKFLGLLVLIITVSLIPELIGGDIAAALKARLGAYYYLTIGGVGLFTILVYTLWTEGDKIFKKSKDQPTAKAVSEDNLQKIRAGLLESYQQRLQSKLAARFPINLELKYSTEGSSTKADIYDNKTIRSSKIKAELITLFDRHRGRLLIIGEPGAGKTTLLLQLAYQLLYRQDSVLTDIPVIINIATWRSRFASVEDWLLELLPQLGFSKALAAQLLEEKRLLPLFDGLDELEAAQRPACLEAIAQYGKAQMAQYVICSRIVEYTETVDAPVYCQILVKPLTLKQIKAGLEEATAPETNGLLDAIKKDQLLAEAIKTPFYLNTVQLLFAASKAWEEFDFKADTLAGRQEEIVAFFVADAAGGFEQYSPEQVKKYLGFLADRMAWKGLVEFELVSLQYDWGNFKKKDKIIAASVSSIVSGFFFSLIGALVFGLAFSIVRLWLFGLAFGLVVGFFFGTALSTIKELIRFQNQNLEITIETTDQIDWSISLFKKTFIKNMIFGLVFSLVFGQTFILLAGFFGNFLVSVLSGLVGGVASGLVISLNISLTEIKTENMRVSLSILRQALTKYFRLGLFIGGLIGLLFSLGFGFAFYLFENLFLGLEETLLLGFAFGLFGSLFEQLSNNEAYLKVSKPYMRFLASMSLLHFSIFQHLHLRWLLCKKGLLPKRLVAFLQKASGQNLLESDGGTWRFRHRILQEYFAGHWAAVYGAEDPGVDPKGDLKTEMDNPSQ